MSSSESDLTPEFIKSKASAIINNLLPEKSKHKYEKAYDDFNQWRGTKAGVKSRVFTSGIKRVFVMGDLNTSLHSRLYIIPSLRSGINIKHPRFARVLIVESDALRVQYATHDVTHCFIPLHYLCHRRAPRHNVIRIEELNASLKWKKFVIMCEGCGQKIKDRYLMRVGDLSWHEHCLSCCSCECPLVNKCYTRNEKLYCKPDYDRLFGVKCTRCGDRLMPQEMVMRAQQYVFHIQCFVCVMCCQPLQKGQQYVMRAGHIFCRQDFEKKMYLMQHAEDDMIVDESGRSRDGRTYPKWRRTMLTSAKRRQFKASFEASPKPCRKVREALAKNTGLSVRVVQVWFQNQRARMKKTQRKGKQKGNKNSEKDKDKDDKSIKQEPPSSDHGNYLGIDGSYSVPSHPLNPNLLY